MTDQLEAIGRAALEHLSLKNVARERALPKSRTAIRYCANSIRASHRQEFETARQLITQAATLIAEMEEDLRDHPDILYAGFVHDAQKEYAEAATFTAIVQDHSLPSATDLQIGWPAYLNGLAEAVGELRRYLLDQLRRGNVDNCEHYLHIMDDIYSLLISIDFPDSITSGLRRTTDATRGIVEKTRGDLTTAIGQSHLQQSLSALQQILLQRPS